MYSLCAYTISWKNIKGEFSSEWIGSHQGNITSEVDLKWWTEAPKVEAWLWGWLEQGMDFFKCWHVVLSSCVRSRFELLTKQLEPHWEEPVGHAKNLKLHPGDKGKAPQNFKQEVMWWDSHFRKISDFSVEAGRCRLLPMCKEEAISLCTMKRRGLIFYSVIRKK